jgi:hypothetical protein
VGVQEVKWKKDGYSMGRRLYLFLWRREGGSSIMDRFFLYIRESYEWLGE